MPCTTLNGPSEGTSFVDKFDTFLFDCDGVIWQGKHLIPGVRLVLENLKRLGKRILFVTNNSTKSRASYLEKFTSLGIETSEDNIFGSSYCAAYYMANNLKFPKNKKIYVFGMGGIIDELESFGFSWVGSEQDDENVKDLDEMAHLQYDSAVSAVLVGFDLHMNYKKLAKAYHYLENKDCLFLATNDDLTFPFPGMM